MLRDRPCYLDDGSLLESVLSDKIRRNLASNADKRDGVHQSVGNASDQVGRSGTGGRNTNPNSPRTLCISLRSKDLSLFMPAKNITNAGCSCQRLMNFQGRSSRICKNEIHPFSFKSLYKHICSFSQLRCFIARSKFGPFWLSNTCAGSRGVGDNVVVDWHFGFHADVPTAVLFVTRSSMKNSLLRGSDEFFLSASSSILGRKN
mmetsp:Transcript_26831/g.46264  ORF Transcript_26831/g.46264 Transcript_26831/m.46264 type:complete len:204 (-) Transcript_26831:240-851(-)